MRLLALALLALVCSGCCCFRDGPTVMYRDGWGGTAVVLPSPCNPVPYAAAMPEPGPGQDYPAGLVTGWYLDNCNQWRPQRWAKLGTPDRTPAYVAVYP